MKEENQRVCKRAPVTADSLPTDRWARNRHGPQTASRRLVPPSFQGLHSLSLTFNQLIPFALRGVKLSY